MEPQEAIESVEHEEHGDHHVPHRHNVSSWVALTVAVLAVFLGVFKVKADNIVEAMHDQQAAALDNWGWYQAHKTRTEVAQTSVAILSTLPSSDKVDKELATWKKAVEDQKGKGEDIQKKAEAAEKKEAALGLRKHQFDLSESVLALAIALLAVTALIKNKKLFYIALVPAAIGIVLGMAGILNLDLHLEFLERMLGP